MKIDQFAPKLLFCLLAYL